MEKSNFALSKCRMWVRGSEMKLKTTFVTCCFLMLCYIVIICHSKEHIKYAIDEIPSVEKNDLSGIWKFKPDRDKVGEPEKWYSPDFDDSSWVDFTVPGVWNEGQNVGVEWNYNGFGWFRREFEIQADWKGGNIKLRFLSVYLIADVWLNGQYLGNHKGGYTAFAYNVSNQLNFSGKNIIVVRADNTPRQFQAPHSSIDWWNCGGISREVYLEKHPDISLEKLHIIPQFNNRDWSIEVRTRLRNRFIGGKRPTATLNIRASVFFNNRIVAQLKKFRESGFGDKETSFQITIPNPQLWSPEHPNLYQLKFSWQTDSDAKWWTTFERFGLRKIETRGSKLFLNGEEIWLQGMAIHHDYPNMGSAVTLEAQRRDLEMIKNLNCNFVRLGHYPFHPYSLDVCDELGLLEWSEIPVWQNPPNELADEKFWHDWVKPQLDEMIEQQYNHPSVIIWSVGNEFSRAWLPDIEPPETIGYVKKSTEYVRSLDSTRLVSYASAAHTGAGTWKFLDINGKPLHYGWFHSNSVYDIRTRLDEIHAYRPNQPILSVECAGMSYVEPHPQAHAGYGANARHSLEYHDKLLRVDLQSLMMKKDYVCGATVWTLADLKGGREVGTYGLLTRERKPKYLYETVRNLYANDPKLLIIEPKTMFLPGEKFQVEFWTFTLKKKLLKDCKVLWWIYGKTGKVAEGEFKANVPPNLARKVGIATWDIPQEASGFHSLICELQDLKGNRLFTNDLHFDIGSPEKPGVLWVETVDKQGNPLSGVTAEVRSFPKTTDAFGRVPFILNAGTYSVKVTGHKGQKREIEARVESGTSTLEKVSF